MPETETQPEPEPWEYCLSVPHDRRAVTVCRRTLRLVLTVHGLIRVADTAWGWQPLSRNGHRGKYVWCDLDAA
ncbi:hypothetical protein [Streptomyces xylophagus]|uniref:hypothetical protein n=1 Tax=Streptomyces xylophagus TaxID=285514 RepID=UPI0005BBBD04|nr:hypothetical protein [Streptomyces xylophagus]